MTHFTVSKTTLWEAAAKNDLARLTVILEEGKVNVNSLDNTGKTPLHYAITNAHKQAIKLLIKQVSSHKIHSTQKKIR